MKLASAAIVNDPVYRQKLLKAARARKLTPAIECMLWHYAYGKPKESRGRRSTGSPNEIADSRGKARGARVPPSWLRTRSSQISQWPLNNLANRLSEARRDNGPISARRSGEIIRPRYPCHLRITCCLPAASTRVSSSARVSAPWDHIAHSDSTWLVNGALVRRSCAPRIGHILASGCSFWVYPGFPKTSG